MSGADIVAIPSDPPFPRADVLDLAVSVVIGRKLASNHDEMFSLVQDWFLRPASRAELMASVARLIDCGWIDGSSDGEFDFRLTEEGVDGATTLSGGMIRMIDRGRGLIKTSYLLQATHLEEGKCP